MPKKINGARRVLVGRGKLSATQVFLVRLWKEARDDPKDRTFWRGTISDLRGHRLGSFGVADEFVENLVRASKRGTILCEDDSRIAD